MTTLREAATLALEALEAMNPYPASKEDQRNKAITALRTALGQQYMTNAAGELEPVTVMKTEVGIGKPEQKAKPITADEMSAWVEDTWKKCQAEAWQERKPLTEEEIQAIWKNTFESGSPPNTFARAIEAAHNIKE